MRISFIIAYHNEPLTMLRECLSSICSLNDVDKDIIVIDDGSLVSPVDCVMSIDDGIRFVRQDNQGLSAARNHGIDCATGDYIQFVDADDKLTPQYADVIKTLEHHCPDVLQFRFIREDSISSKSLRITFDGTGRQRLCEYNLRAAACAYVFRRDILQGVRFVKGIYHEDELFTPLLFLNAERIIDTDAQAYYYRQREESITTTRSNSKIQKRLDDTVYVIKALRDVHDEALARRIAQLTMDYMYNVVKLTGNFTDFKHRCNRLRELSLLPLPVKCYSVKYMLFAFFTRIFLH